MIPSRRILSFDQSLRQTGFALYDAPGDERRIRCGSFASNEPDDPAEQIEVFAKHVKKLIGIHKPAFLVWEKASRRISAFEKKDEPGLVPHVGAKRWTVQPSQLILNQLVGVLIGAAVFYRLPHESVDVSTWRAAIYGKGGGKLTTREANARALEYCARLGIKANNDNEREAACIARWASTCSQRFKYLQHGVAA